MGGILLLAKTCLGTTIGRIVAASLLGLVALKGYGLYERNKGADQAIATINKQSEKLTSEAVKERRKADLPGSADRLKRSYCRDCKP